MTNKSPHKKASDIKIEVVPLTDAKLDDLNANLGTEIGRSMLQTSLQKHGGGRSVLLDKNGVAIAGNKTVETAVDIGMEQMIIVHTDGKQLVAVMRDDIDIDTPQGRELAILDNRVGELDLSWSEEAFKKLQNDVDFTKLFPPSELDKLLSTVDNLGVIFTDPNGVEMQVKELGLGWAINVRFVALALSFGAIGAKVNELYATPPDSLQETTE